MTSARPICHLNLASGFAGGERQTLILIRELAARGIPQRLVVCESSGLGKRCEGLPGLDIRAVSGNAIAAAFHVRGARLAHAHDGRAVYAALLARRLFGVPYVITRRIVTSKPISGLRGLAYNGAARVAAVSQAAATALEQNGLRSRVVPILSTHAEFSVDDAEVARIRAAHPGKTLLGHTGALRHAAKGQSTIIEVAQRAAITHPDWHFLLCGEGEDRKRFEREIGDLNNVELVGWVDNVGDYLAAFDVFVFPSPKEALGSSLLDALQFGLPIVASNVEGIPEVVEDGVNGRLVEPENAEQLYAAIEALLADEGELAAIRARNKEKSKLHSATHMADAYETLYEEIATSV